MEYFDEEDYIRRSPGLEAVHPTKLACEAPVFPPLWLPQDVAGSPWVIHTSF
jgi:hypothetical protein